MPNWVDNKSILFENFFKNSYCQEVLLMKSKQTNDFLTARIWRPSQAIVANSASSITQTLILIRKVKKTKWFYPDGISLSCCSPLYRPLFWRTIFLCTMLQFVCNQGSMARRSAFPAKFVFGAKIIDLDLRLCITPK